MNLTLVVVGKDQQSLDGFRQTHVNCDLRMIANSEGCSLAAIANREMESSRDMFGLVHADTLFRHGALEAFAECAAKGSVCGIVGRDGDGQYRWCFNPVGFKDGIVSGPGPVNTLDSCSVFFRVDCGLRFDERTFDSFHCHVEDLCLQAHMRGIQVCVPAADATHLAPAPAPEWQAEYAPYRERLARKWPDMLVVTT